MKRTRSSILVLAIAATLLPPMASKADAPGQVLAGAAKIDSTWHVGASAGQYAGTPGPGWAGPGGTYEPHQQSMISRPSYGLQGREWVRALVFEGSDGTRAALVANDLYIPQDLVNRRVAGLLAEHDASVSASRRTRINDANMMVSVSHSHSSPYYSTPAWGPWAFQDTFDIRFFDHITRKMADAVIAATQNMVPARVGGSVSYFDLLQRHSYGPTVGDDGTPAGFPQADFPYNRSVEKTENEKTVFVVRVDDISDPDAPQPLANWVTFGLHPEFLDGNDLLTGEYVNTMYRYVDREVGGVTLFSQENTGTAEPARDAASVPASARSEYSHREYAQMERGARRLADIVKKTRDDIANGTPEDPDQFSAFQTEFVVKMADARFAPPSYRPSPTVSNCRTEKIFQGNPGIPLIGLPDCNFAAGGATGPVVQQLPVSPSVAYDTLRGAGVPVPDNYGAPSWIGLQETLTVHLQVLRLGDIAITVCPCEQWGDQARNIRSRLNKVDGDFWTGFDYTRHKTPGGRDWCVQNADTRWTCADPRNPNADLAPVTDLAYKRMKAQINNDARGWEDLEYTLHSEYDPPNPADIKGNFTREEHTAHGYALVIPVGMTNDYWGYIATYREFQRGDHYRKALTGLGPHSADFLATRLSRMGANLNGANYTLLGPKDLAYAAENDREYLSAQLLGEAARTYVPLYEATLPASGGTARIVRQPKDVKRFDAASVRWVGGDNYTDIPDVRVERYVNFVWTPFANGEGEVQYRVFYPTASDLSSYRAGTFEWNWEATFEAVRSDIVTTDLLGNSYTATPPGMYRFVIEGKRREGTPPSAKSYRLASDPFFVSPWNGITVEDLRFEDDGSLSFGVGPVNHYKYGINDPAQLPDPRGWRVGPIDFPDTAPALSIYPFITARDQAQNLKRYVQGFADDEQFCLECSFRPWLDAGDPPREVSVEVDGEDESFTASAILGPDGRYRTAPLGAVIAVRIEAGAITDAAGEYNGKRYELFAL